MRAVLTSRQPFSFLTWPVRGQTGRSFCLRFTYWRASRTPASVLSGSGRPRAGAGGVVFPKLSKVLNQEGALSAPFYAVISAQRRRPRGARECCGEANQPLWMSHYHLRSANHRASSADDLPEIGGECTDRAARCKAGQGCRVGRPRYVNAYTRSSTVLGRVESEGKKISLVTMAARCS
jgi:hypothetical protein